MKLIPNLVDYSVPLLLIQKVANINTYSPHGCQTFGMVLVERMCLIIKAFDPLVIVLFILKT